MDCRTGKIGTMENLVAGGSTPSDLIGIEYADATKKQLSEQKVSLHDHHSKLGKKLTLTRNQRRKLNKKFKLKYGV
jgi:uncharacterized 2Fe-2S/4Fe-4S cluster protein (DUF4445 family)